eukprot:CAMPEP_0115036752 /NCGR_PEP_ID=MMETSP0216-20121206/42322_1 /TAXON_ID=223996 /ORGANISM="Protocruzia adherens, Strain Boccale" /LENGTH=129 /DNA_ID=CAMNT_0002416665 /DNA_START=402 /DNA_END=788 /DNA_ORIENTATION=-
MACNGGTKLAMKALRSRTTFVVVAACDCDCPCVNFSRCCLVVFRVKEFEVIVAVWVDESGCVSGCWVCMMWVKGFRGVGSVVGISLGRGGLEVKVFWDSVERGVLSIVRRVVVLDGELRAEFEVNVFDW